MRSKITGDSGKLSNIAFIKIVTIVMSAPYFFRGHGLLLLSRHKMKIFIPYYVIFILRLLLRCLVFKKGGYTESKRDITKPMKRLLVSYLLIFCGAWF